MVLHACYWEWSLNAQYSYGFLVPVLCLLLAGRRWADRPAPASPGRKGTLGAWSVIAVSGLLLAGLQPMVVSNADWRMVPAVAATAGVAATLGFVYLLGGAPWVRHFAFPFLFFLVAVPWPRPQESAIMGWLMSHNTALCVEALHWIGYAAEQRGNLIAIPGAVLGVEEACSGIRSLQSMIMVSLAIGEFFRLGTARRVALLAIGLGAALAGNSVRSLTLSIAACRNGSGAVEHIHDSTGLAVLLAASAAVVFAGKIMAPRRPAVITQDPEFSLPRPLPGAKTAALVLIALGVSSLAGSEAWFRWHDDRTGALPARWTLSLPSPGQNARSVPIAPRTLDILLYPDTARSEQWLDDNGWQWQSFYFHWPPGPTSVQSAFVVHDPRVCLGAAGFQFERQLEPWTAQAGRFAIRFQRFLFRDRGRTVHVFHAVVGDDGTTDESDPAAGFDAAVRWRNLVQGRRNKGLRVLEFAVRGPADAVAAERAAAEWLARRIVVADKQSDK